MDITLPDRFFCSRTAGLVSALPACDYLTLVQGLVFAQIGADQQQVKKPHARWQGLQATALQSLEWSKQHESHLDQASDQGDLNTSQLLRAFAGLHLSLKEANAMCGLIEALTDLPSPPSALGTTSTGTLSLAVVSTARYASIITVTSLAESGDNHPQESADSCPPLTSVHLSFAQYRIDPDFWLLRDQLQSAVGKYVGRHLTDLGRTSLPSLA